MDKVFVKKGHIPMMRSLSVTCLRISLSRSNKSLFLYVFIDVSDEVSDLVDVVIDGVVIGFDLTTLDLTFSTCFICFCILSRKCHLALVVIFLSRNERFDAPPVLSRRKNQ